MLSLLIIPFIILIVAHRDFDESLNKIMPLTDDIINVNRIIIDSVQLITEASLYASRNYTLVINQRIPNIIDSHIESLSDIVSEDRQFTSETLEMLHRNACIHYIPNTSRPSCIQVMKGVTEKGITSIILTMKDYVRIYKYKIENTPWSTSKVSALLNDTDYYDALYYITYGMSPTISVYEREILDRLTTDLSEGTQATIVAFSLGLAFGIIMSISIGSIIYGVMWKNRRKTCCTLLILPLELIMTNKHLKPYLLRGSNKFHKLAKKYEQIKKKEELLEDKIKASAQ